MLEVSGALIVSAFIAGVLTFLAPCTLPLVPAYLALIGGVSLTDAQHKGGSALRKKVLLNSVAFVVGFSSIFILLGAAAGLFGMSITPYREAFSMLGGGVIVVFGLLMLGVFRGRSFFSAQTFRVPTVKMRGSPVASFVVGASLAFGWTPCIGPILATILLLASTGSSAFSGAFLLAVFSLGLAIPFLLLALLLGSAEKIVTNLFSLLTKWRVLVFALLGLILGVFLEIILIGFGALTGLQAIGAFGSSLLTHMPYLLPTVTAVLLSVIAYKKSDIDVISTTGGLLLVALGLLLLTNSFSLLVQYGFELFASFGYETFILQLL